MLMAPAVSGSAVFAGIEGTRPLLVEIQALVGQPGVCNTTTDGGGLGFSARLSMVLAVLETRCLYDFQGRDVFLNVAGGLRLAEPAADLAAAAALVSALLDKPVPRDVVLFGEVGLSGELRPVGQESARLREAERLGFGRALAALADKGKSKDKSKDAAHGALASIRIPRLSDLTEWLREGGLNPNARPRSILSVGWRGCSGRIAVSLDCLPAWFRTGGVLAWHLDRGLWSRRPISTRKPAPSSVST